MDVPNKRYRLLIADATAAAYDLRTVLIESGAGEVQLVENERPVDRLVNDTFDVLIVATKAPELAGLDTVQALRRKHHDTKTWIALAVANASTMPKAYLVGLAKAFGADQIVPVPVKDNEPIRISPPR